MSDHAQYQSDYRRRNPEYVKRQKQLETLRKQARRILSERHPAEYEQVLAELKAKEGL